MVHRFKRNVVFIGLLIGVSVTVYAARQSVTQNQTMLEASPVMKTDPIDSYFNFKQRFYQRHGFNWNINYSLMHMQRADEFIADENYNTTGQLDLIGAYDIFDGDGQFFLFYMDVRQISGLTTTEFGERNGNITPINDSDPTELLRRVYYRHRFLAERLEIAVGKTEPSSFFADNRFAADDRQDFQALPLATVAAKDRLFSSAGLLINFKITDWFSIGGSLNELDSENVVPDLVDVELYSFFNITFDIDAENLGQGIYRINTVLTDAQGSSAESDGYIISFDQDLGSVWGAFLRYDDTSIQTLANPINESFAFGFYNRSPFKKSKDRLGIGVFRTRSDSGGSFKEWGGEVFYRFGLSDWANFSLALQVFDPAKGNDVFFNMGGRIFIGF